jgi:hypothetical protein
MVIMSVRVRMKRSLGTSSGKTLVTLGSMGLALWAIGDFRIEEGT